jgi:hypothetical protein
MLLQILMLQSSKLVVFEGPGCLAVGASANLWLVVDTEHHGYVPGCYNDPKTFTPVSIGKRLSNGLVGSRLYYSYFGSDFGFSCTFVLSASTLLLTQISV